MEIHSKNFGDKEHILNYACQLYQLSRPSKVGEVMALIRECQPSTFKEWEAWYLTNAYTKTKNPAKITPEILTELGERLYDKIQTIIRPKWEKVFNELSVDDCIAYIFNLTLNRTYDGYIREKSVINDGLAKIFNELEFEESNPELDHAGDVDYIAHIGDKQIGFQIKPVTANFNFGGFSLTERMKDSFDTFTKQYGGKVFVIFSLKGEICNNDIIDDISQEIRRLKSLNSDI